MTFDALLTQVGDLLQRQGRLSYRALKVRFQLDDDLLEALKDELIYAQRVAADEDGRVVVWMGETASPSSPGPAPARVQERVPLAYTPAHLAEKILTSRSALEGERKQVTVLFADLKGSMELLAERDPEEARQLLDPVLERMIEAVHRYEGTVNQVMGDGIMALFGAPIAHEDHAVRACYAALRMQETVTRYGDEMQRSHGVPVQIRVGLNSGEVVVRAIDSSLHMDYTAVGQTTHLAARMEQMAKPGSVLTTGETLRLAEGFVQVKALGPVSVKGLADRVEVFELVGAGSTRTRMQAFAARGLTRFVGRQAEIEALRQALERAGTSHGQESQVQPLLLVFENLHWIDAETQAVLDSLIESLPTARLLLLVNYRPEYQHGWGNRTYYTQLRLDPLPPASAEELLQALLGDDPSLVSLKRLLIERTEGNPFFLEESVRALVETGVLVGARGAYRLAKPLESMQVPATVQAVLAARIDRLPPEEKRLLQTAAVIGTEMPFGLLQAIGELPEEELRRGLGGLQAAEFLYETSLFPELEYTFKHALTHEVAYGSLLQERRRALHASIVAASERLYADRLTEQAERLAQHAFRGEVWDKAVAYCRQAGTKVFARSAFREAVACFAQALEALTHLPESRATQEQAIDLRFDLRSALITLGEFRQMLDYLREAAILAEALSLLEQAEQSAAATGTMGGQSLRVSYLSEAYLLAGRMQEAVQLAGRTLDLARAHKERGHEAWALRLLGEIAAHQDPPEVEPAAHHYRQARALAEELGMRPLVAHCHLGLGTLYARTGQRQQARAALSTASEMYRTMEMTFWLPQAEVVLAQVEEW